MNNARQYREDNLKLMLEYEEKSRAWLHSQNGKSDISDRIPFSRDGVVNPEYWFKEGNDFRPLFILKEPSIGINTADQLPDFDREWDRANTPEWNHLSYFEYVENPLDDIQVGCSTTWKRIMALTIGLEAVAQRREPPKYDIATFAYSKGQNNFSFPVPQIFLQKRTRTGNQTYIDTAQKIAVINLKKMCGGTNVGSSLSKESGYYFEYTKGEFRQLLERQIRLISPSIIILCGTENGRGLSRFLDETILSSYPFLEVQHPSRISVQKFYTDTLEKYNTMLEAN